MRKSRRWLDLGLLCLATALGWYFRGVFERLGGSGNGPPAQVIEGRGKADGIKNHSVRDVIRLQDSAVPDAVPAGGPPADPPATGEVPGAALAQGPFQSQPLATLPSGVRPEDVEVSPETGLAAIRRVTANAPTQPQTAATLPPGVRPEDVEVSPETGQMTIRRVTANAPSQPQSVATLPPGVRPGDVEFSPETGVMVLRRVPVSPQTQPPGTAAPPDRKAPDNPPTSKPPKE